MSFGRYTLWRLLVTDLDGVHITTLDSRAHDRTITYEQNTSTVFSGKPASDDHEINETHTDGFPFLAEGDRLIYALRRDYDGDPDTNSPYTCRAAGLVLQYEDDGQENDEFTTFTAFDAWQYLMTLPVVNPDDPDNTGNYDILYKQSTVDSIIIDLFENALPVYNLTHGSFGVQNFFVDWGQTGFYTGTIETLPVIDHTFQKGTSIGQALKDLCERGHCDLVFEPIYDPVNRPGFLNQLSILEFRGEEKPEAIFAWDLPSHSTQRVSRLVDGTRRANKVRWHIWQGGPAVSTRTEGASVARFGEYWSEQFIVKDEHSASVDEFAEEFIDTYSEHARTVNLNPIPERSPEPFLEYDVGDSVRVFSSKNLRATMSGFQRVTGFTLEISDDQLETVRDLKIYIVSDAVSST